MESVDAKQTLFTNLLLLDFDISSLEKKHRTVSFDKNMFDLPNKTALEEVLHFLLSKLDPNGSLKDFRDCWPILDKKQEQQFKKVATTWLNNITKNEPDSHLPRLVPLFISSHGDKVYTYLLALSRFVLQKHLISKFKKERFKDFAGRPSLNNGTQVNLKLMAALICRVRSSFVSRMRQLVDVEQKWEDTIEMIVKSYREDVRILSELSKKEMQEDENTFHSTKDVEVSPSKISEASNLISRFDKCLERMVAKRAIFESVIDGSADKFAVHGGSIHITFPDQLVKECEAEIVKKEVKSIRVDGDLDLLSVFKLWNISARRCKDSLTQGGIPDLKSLNLSFACFLSKIKYRAKEFSKLNCDVSENVLPDLRKLEAKLTEMAIAKAVAKRAGRPPMKSKTRVVKTPPAKNAGANGANRTFNFNIFEEVYPPRKAETTEEVTERILKEVDEALARKKGIQVGNGDVNHNLNHEQMEEKEDRVVMEPMDQERNVQNSMKEAGIDEDYFKSSVVTIPKGGFLHKAELKKSPPRTIKASMKRSVAPQKCALTKVTRSSDPDVNLQSGASSSKGVAWKSSDRNSTTMSRFREGEGHLDVLANEIVDQFLGGSTRGQMSADSLIENVVKNGFPRLGDDDPLDAFKTSASFLKSKTSTNAPEEIFPIGNHNENAVTGSIEPKREPEGAGGADTSSDTRPSKSGGGSDAGPIKSEGDSAFRLSDDAFFGSPSRESLPFQGLESLQLRRMTASLADLARTKTPQLPARRKEIAAAAAAAATKKPQADARGAFSKLLTYWEGVEDVDQPLPAKDQKADLKLPSDLDVPNKVDGCSGKEPDAFDWSDGLLNESDSAWKRGGGFRSGNDSKLSDAPSSCDRRTSMRFQLSDDIFNMEIPFNLPKFDESINSVNSNTQDNSIIDLSGFDDKNLMP